MEVQYHFRIASVHNIESTRNILAWVNCVLVEQLLVILNQLNWYYCAIAHKNTLHRIHYLIYTSVFREASPYQMRSFFTLFKRGGGRGRGETHGQKFCCKFCMILKAFWQHKFGIKILFKGRNVPNLGSNCPNVRSVKKFAPLHVQNKLGGWGVRGCLNNVKKTALLVGGGFPR